jgi:hypothetical protein
VKSCTECVTGYLLNSYSEPFQVSSFTLDYSYSKCEVCPISDASSCTESDSYFDGCQCVTVSVDNLVAYHETSDITMTMIDKYYGYPICSLISSE